MKTPTLYRMAPKDFWLAWGTHLVMLTTLVFGVAIGSLPALPWWVASLIGLGGGIAVASFTGWVTKRQWRAYWERLEEVLEEIRTDAKGQPTDPSSP